MEAQETVKYKIETGVPLPPLGSRSRYPLADMKVQDAFKVPADNGTDIDVIVRRVRNALYAFTQREEYKDRKFATRTDRKERHVMVFRVQ